MRSNDLATESHIRFDGNQIFGRTGVRASGRRLNHVPPVFRVKHRDGRAALWFELFQSGVEGNTLEFL